MDWPEYYDLYLFLVEPFSNLLAEHVDIGLVDVPALVDQRDRVVYRDVLQLLLLLLPVLVQNKQQLLRPACGKDRQQTLPPSLHDLVDVFLKLLLPETTVLVGPRPESALGDEDVHVLLGNLRFHDIPILFTTIISSVENPHSIDLDNKHRSSNDMPSDIRSDLDPILLSLDLKSRSGRRRG